MAIKRSEKHGFNLHVGTHIFKKLNKTIDNNGTMETFETTEKAALLLLVPPTAFLSQ